MKTIEFDGRKFEVEDWVKYIAQDGNGKIYSYMYEPVWDSEYKQWVGLAVSLVKERMYTPLIKEV